MHTEVTIQDCQTRLGLEPSVWQTWFTGWLESLDPHLSPQDAYELCLRLTDDQEVKQLNSQFRSRLEPTDVLAFPNLGGLSLAQEPLYLGDIVISVDTAQRQADQYGHSLKTEAAWLATHGLLHLIGWDHPDESSLQKMWSWQGKLLTLVGLEPPVAFREELDS